MIFLMANFMILDINIIIFVSIYMFFTFLSQNNTPGISDWSKRSNVKNVIYGDVPNGNIMILHINILIFVHMLSFTFCHTITLFSSKIWMKRTVQFLTTWYGGDEANRLIAIIWVKKKKTVFLRTITDHVDEECKKKGGEEVRQNSAGFLVRDGRVLDETRKMPPTKRCKKGEGLSPTFYIPTSRRF
jgi:hypothetical protein